MACRSAANSTISTRARLPPPSAAARRSDGGCLQNSQPPPASTPAPAKPEKTPMNSQLFPIPDLAHALHDRFCDLGLTHVLNESAGAPDIPAPGLHFIFR